MDAWPSDAITQVLALDLGYHYRKLTVPSDLLRVFSYSRDEVILHLVTHARRDLQNDLVQPRRAQDVDVVASVRAAARNRGHWEMRELRDRPAGR